MEKNIKSLDFKKMRQFAKETKLDESGIIGLMTRMLFNHNEYGYSHPGERESSVFDKLVTVGFLEKFQRMYVLPQEIEYYKGRDNIVYMVNKEVFEEVVELEIV